jgi:hypothetical protein
MQDRVAPGNLPCQAIPYCLDPLRAYTWITVVQLEAANPAAGGICRTGVGAGVGPPPQHYECGSISGVDAHALLL